MFNSRSSGENVESGVAYTPPIRPEVGHIRDFWGYVIELQPICTVAVESGHVPEAATCRQQATS